MSVFAVIGVFFVFQRVKWGDIQDDTEGIDGLGFLGFGFRVKANARQAESFGMLLSRTCHGIGHCWVS